MPPWSSTGRSAFLEWLKWPTTVKELQDFLGTVNFSILSCRWLGSQMCGTVHQAQLSFWIGQRCMQLPGCQSLARPSAPAEMAGAFLQERTAVTAALQPLGFFSKKLEPAQNHYSAFNRELWACFSSIRHFRHMLEGRQFILFTDYKLLTRALFRTSDPLTPRHCMQLNYIAKHTSNIRHIAGLDIVVADILSPPPLSPSQSSAPVQPIQVPAEWFSHIHVDTVGPFPVAADGSTYLLTIIDRTIRWLEAVSLRSMEATTCAD
jgi:hypothetical protein